MTICQSKSLPNNLYKAKTFIKQSNSFHDFKTLRLYDNEKYISYGTFLYKHPKATRNERRNAIQKFYFNKI